MSCKISCINSWGPILLPVLLYRRIEHWRLYSSQDYFSATKNPSPSLCSLLTLNPKCFGISHLLGICASPRLDCSLAPNHAKGLRFHEASLILTLWGVPLRTGSRFGSCCNDGYIVWSKEGGRLVWEMAGGCPLITVAHVLI